MSLQSPELHFSIGTVGNASTTSSSDKATCVRHSVQGNLSNSSPWEISLEYAPMAISGAGGALLHLNLTVDWNPVQSAVRKVMSFFVDRPAPALVLTDIILERFENQPLGWLPIDAAQASQESYPAFYKGYFAAVEFPYASTGVSTNDTFAVSYQPGHRFRTSDATVPRRSHPAVYGIVPAGERPLAAFDVFVGGNRVGHKGRHFNYNVWWTLAGVGGYSSSVVMSLIETMKEQLYTAFNGTHYDSFILDLGWSEPNSFWEISTPMRSALGVFRTALAEIGTNFGLWISPSSMYPPATNCSWLAEHGYEVMPNNVGCFGGPKYSAAWAAVVRGLVKDHSVRYLKLDGLNPNCPDTTHGHEPGALGNDVLISNFIAALDGAREESPDLYLEGTFAEPYPSPFWLWHIDSMMSSCAPATLHLMPTAPPTVTV